MSNGIINLHQDQSRLSRAWYDPVVSQARMAFIRNIINILATAADFGPLVGEVPGWVLEAAALLRRKANFGIDPLPNVPTWVFGLEFLDLGGTVLGAVLTSMGIVPAAALAFIPSYIVATLWQLVYDTPKLWRGFWRWWGIVLLNRV